LNNTTGIENIALGYQAGYKLTTGNYNIEIGTKGAGADHRTIKIGTEGIQATTFIAGIYNVPLTGNAVVVTSTGQLGVAAVSSERFKTAIVPMGSNTAKLEQLRPVTFKLKTDAKGTLQYGLIAEEVAKVYPELVIRDENGRIDGVRYDELAPMLLNELKQQQQKIAAQANKINSVVEQNADQATEIRDLKQQVAELNDLKQEMRAALLKLQNKDELVAQR
jgi:Chaperone of endosialidase